MKHTLCRRHPASLAPTALAPGLAGQVHDLLGSERNTRHATGRERSPALCHRRFDLGWHCAVRGHIAVTHKGDPLLSSGQLLHNLGAQDATHPWSSGPFRGPGQQTRGASQAWRARHTSAALGDFPASLDQDAPGVLPGSASAPASCSILPWA